MTITWLHLSDVHEHRGDDYHREAMYGEIIKAVRARAVAPDFVFLTGDLAFAGVGAEYASLADRFLSELKQALPELCGIFMVPGNHDANRDATTPPRLWAVDEVQRRRFEEVSADGLKMRRQALLPRFAAYRVFELAHAAWGEDWLDTEGGSICRLVDVGDTKVAIVGINTAWLCQDENDWGQITAGRTMLDSALRRAEAANPDLTIVLGHHPFEAMMGEVAWSDQGGLIRQRMARAKAVYLHGHLHTAGSHPTGSPLRSALAIQAPSAFQAPDSPIWRNGIMWGKADPKAGRLCIEPLKWNGGDGEYKFDTDAGLNSDLTKSRDAFCLLLPGSETLPVGHSRGEARALPLGWRAIDQGALANLTADAPDLRVMVGYFDGSLPDWRVALAQGIQSRRIVEDMIVRFRQRHTSGPRPLVELLTGAGGEGKSTAVLQVAAGLVRDATQSWTCLHREAAAAAVPEELFQGLEHREGHAWIIVVDDAENIARELVSALRQIAPRIDVHLLLAAREADWAIHGLTRDMWREVGEFRQEAMPALDEEDARRIVEGWQSFGDEAMGELQGVSAELAAKALVGHAKDHASRPGEAALLGALLFTRQGEGLKDRVRDFVAPLKERGGVKGYDLRDIYAMIAAMHSENQLYLSRGVLAFALGCEESELDQALRILRREAMLDSGETYILTRHRRIAEAACEAMKEDGYNLNRWYAFLSKAARKEFVERHSRNPDIARWDFGLASYFIAKGPATWPLARNVAKSLFEAQKNDTSLLTSYSKTLRETDAPQEAMELLKNNSEALRYGRDIIYEWSVVAGALDDWCLDAWLAGRSLSDGGSALSSKQCKLSLAGLGRAFELLHRATRQKLFADAMAACGQLGLWLSELDVTSRGHFKRYLETKSTGKNLTSEDCVKLVQRAVIVASEEMEQDRDPLFFERLVGEPSDYRYENLLRIVAGGAAGELPPSRA